MNSLRRQCEFIRLIFSPIYKGIQGYVFSDFLGDIIHIIELMKSGVKRASNQKKDYFSMIFSLLAA